MDALRRSWEEFWYGQVDSLRLEALRQALGYCLLAYMLVRAQYATEWLTAEGFHPSAEADPSNYPRLPLLPPALLWPAGLMFFGSIAAWLFGWARRFTAWLVWIGVVYVTYVDGISAFTLNRLFIICLLILALAPEPEQSPRDRARPDPAPDPERRDRQETSVRTQIAWPLRMIQVLLPVHYLAAGLCKVFHGDWASSSDVLWMQVQGFYMTDFAAWMVRVMPQWGWTAFQHAALAFELAAPLLFAVRRLRPVAFVVGAGFHLMVAATMYQLIYFSAQMLALYVVFLPPRWLYQLQGWIDPGPGRAADARDTAGSDSRAQPSG